MTLAELNDHYALPGILAFEQPDELTRAQITLPSCTATVYLHGAHLTQWQPAGQPPVLYLSPLSDFAPGKPIRGGIPVCFPWFGNDSENRADGKPGPSHGFARTQAWDVAFAALAGDSLHLTLTLGPTDLSRSFGYGSFRVAYEFIFGAGAGNKLELRLSVANTGDQPLRFEQALHTYFAADPRHAQITGLESAPFFDKTDALKEKTGPAGPLLLTQWTDRVYPGNTATTHIATHIAVPTRTISIAKQNSATTVVWNPYPQASAGIRDLAPDSWEHFLCVETANTGTDAITLSPGGAHTMQATITCS